jgi:hypothetical protein
MLPAYPTRLSSASATPVVAAHRAGLVQTAPSRPVLQARKRAAERVEHELAPLPVVEVGRMHDDGEQEALSVDQDVALAPGEFPEERRDIVWALLTLGGLIYDLERRVIIGLLPRPGVGRALGAAWRRAVAARRVFTADGVAVGAGSVWLADANDGTVERITPET